MGNHISEDRFTVPETTRQVDVRTRPHREMLGGILQKHGVRNASVFACILLIVSFVRCPPLLSLSPEEDWEESEQISELFLELKGLKGFSVKEFNRVDGFVPWFRMNIRSVEEGKYPSLYLSTIYHMARGRLGWEIALEKTYDEEPKPLIKVEWFRFTDTNDRWRISDLENSLSAFFLKEDFRNYHEKTGFRFSLEWELDFFYEVAVSFTDQTVRSLAANSPFTLFGWSKEFRENPAVFEGRERNLRFEWEYDSRDNIRFPKRGWHNNLSLVVSPEGFRGDFSYRLLTAHLRRYNVLFGDQFLNFRFSFALGSNDLPPHRLITIGGVGTMRGYSDLEDSGRNFIVANVEYRFPIRGLKWKPLRIVFNEIQGLLFLDVGDAWSEGWKVSNLQPNIGLGISGANIFSYFGLYVAQPVGTDGMGPRVTVKMERDF